MWGLPPARAVPAHSAPSATLGRLPALRLRPVCLRYYGAIVLGWLMLSIPALAAGLTIGAEDDWFPYSGVQDGRPAGLAVDIVTAAFRAAGLGLNLQSLPYSRCMILTRQKQLAGCFDSLRNPRIEADYQWHRTPLFQARIVIYARSDDGGAPIQQIEQLYGQRVAVTHGYEYGARFDDDARMLRDPGLRDIDALRKLGAGRVRYALVYEHVARYLLAQQPQLASQIKTAGTLLSADLFLAFAPDQAELAQRFEQGLRSLHQSGEYQRIVARWH